jgi:hypothetical protein
MRGRLRDFAVMSVLGAFTLGLLTGGTVATIGATSVPSVPVASVPAMSEDSPGWDCLRQGNVTCRIDGVLVTSIEGMPDDPYLRCVFLLGISARVGGVDYSDDVCTPIAGQRG